MIVAVESTEDKLQYLMVQISQAYPGAEVEKYTDPLMALKACRDNPARLAVAAYDLKHMDGMEFLRLLKRLNPGVVAALVDDSEGRRQEAESLRLNFLVRPVTPEKLFLFNADGV